MAQAIPVGNDAFKAKLAFVDKIIDNPDDVIVDIYVITDSSNNKNYVGQSVTHRLNNGRYRPYGYISRFKSHQSQARNNSPSKPVYELQTAMRDHMHAFSVKLVMRCPKDEADTWERHFVQVYNSCVPNGYNQTVGGKGHTVVVMLNPDRVVPNYDHVARKPTDPHTEETKAKIGEGIRRYMEDNKEVPILIAKRARNQHLEKKYTTSMPFKVDVNQIDKYIVHTKNNVVVRFERKRGGHQVDFHIGKSETVGETEQRAKDFLMELARRQDAQVINNEE
jgi:hypothetical protein